jgi:hypothetical protein
MVFALLSKRIPGVSILTVLGGSIGIEGFSVSSHPPWGAIAMAMTSVGIGSRGSTP